MGLEFLGNPYENSNDGDSDVEIERDELGDEEWVVPQNVSFLFILSKYSIS